MRNRFAGREVAHARQGELAEAGIGVAPVEGMSPTLALHGGPAAVEPEGGRLVPAVLDEGEVLRIGHEPIAERVCLDEDAMSRALVVESEWVSESVIRRDSGR